MTWFTARFPISWWGRTGLMGRFNGMINGYFSNKPNIALASRSRSHPEAIEQVPVLYDVLFEAARVTAPNPIRRNG